jgi:hypothetical protein
MPKRRYDSTLAPRILKLYKTTRKTYREIGEIVGCSHELVYYYVKKYKQNETNKTRKNN